ncbi:MAG: hypothetical protein V1910_00695 [bacterium]
MIIQYMSEIICKEEKCNKNNPPTESPFPDFVSQCRHCKNNMQSQIKDVKILEKK